MFMNFTIKEIKEKLQKEDVELNTEWFQELKKDKRKGIQQLIYQVEKKKEEDRLLKAQYKKMQTYEMNLVSKGYQHIAGIDEVGRGPLAGPVVAASVILPNDCYIPRLNDSKKLSEKVREELYDVIMMKAISVGVGIVSATEIDELNILQATIKAMTRAIFDMEVKPDFILIDALELDIPVAQKGIESGDSKSVSIAAGSVIAKVTRDRMMKELAIRYPQYGFDQHMGYGTKQHIDALEKYGPCPEHRRTFAPVRDMLPFFE